MVIGVLHYRNAVAPDSHPVAPLDPPLLRSAGVPFATTPHQ